MISYQLLTRVSYSSSLPKTVAVARRTDFAPRLLGGGEKKKEPSIHCLCI